MNFKQKETAKRLQAYISTNYREMTLWEKFKKRFATFIIFGK
jgi:hypothetical protein